MLADAWQALHPAHQRALYRGLPQRVYACCQQGRDDHHHLGTMGVNKTAPFQQQARHERNALAHILKHLRKARHDVQQQETDDQRTDTQNHCWVDGGADDALAQRFRLRAVLNEALDRFDQAPGAFVGAHPGHIEGRKHVALALQRSRQRQTVAEVAVQLGQYSADVGPRLAGGQGFDRFDHRQAALEQDQQALIELQ